jgi:predicted nucleotidyltransferase component of viral defense system
MFDKMKLENLRKELKFSDPGIFEKTVFAFNLLGDLVKFYPEMIFKGGTSLLLHQFPPFRFSIDIDILLPEKDKKSIEKNLRILVQESSAFESVEEDERESKVPKAHYKFYYDSQFGRKGQYVLLDIVFCKHPYHKIVKKQLKGQYLMLMETDAVIKIPSPEGLFADKIGAIAPKTIGLALNKQREMEFVKQIIDLTCPHSLYQMLLGRQ